MAADDSGERRLQQQMGSQTRANRFYDTAMQSRLNAKMVTLIQRQAMVFVATADAAGNCDCSPRFGEPGFVRVIDDTTLAYPEYRGNGVYACLGNMLENPHVGLAFVDFLDTTVGLHVNGAATHYAADAVPDLLGQLRAWAEQEQTKRLERWVVVTVHEAYIHCSKHVPRLALRSKHIEWGTDDPQAKQTDYFD